ncbi:O-antigen ligase family protein [Candidatus Methylomirabilis sp.]|uniref:O-antigen ligase family protein n=1 Tax=Candidatus Methylomirabilis sp. TaxID=2032687 RepID=UPI002A65E3AB|nr:O-antigen ligase family protein [Candidatus Methylomirabilis sp.]
MVGDRNSDLRTWSLVGAMLALVAAAAYVISVFQPTTALIIGLSALVILAAMINVDVALYILIFSMLLGPQVVVSEAAGTSLASRGLTLRLDDLLLVVIGLLWLARIAIYSDVGVFTKTPLNRQIAWYTFACILSTGVGMVFGRVEVLTGSLFTLKYIEYFLIYFLTANSLKNRTQVRNYTVALLVVALIVSVIGIAQIPAGGRASAPFEDTGEGIRAANAEPNSFGGYLVLMLALALSVLLTQESRRVKLTLTFLAALLLSTLGLTLSRASYLALVPLYLSLLFFSKRRTGLLIGALLTAGAFVIFAPPNILERIEYTYTAPREAEQVIIGQLHLDSSTTIRLRNWQTAFTEGLPQHPLLGSGVTGWGLVDAQYPRTLVELGVFGFTIFLWLILSTFRSAKDHYRQVKDPLLKGVTLGFLVGHIAILTHAIGANSFIIVRIMEPYWFLAAIAMMAPQLEEQPSSAQAPPAFAGIRR